MEFTKSELRVMGVVFLNPGLNVEDLSEKVDLSIPRVYAIVGSLVERNIMRRLKGGLYPPADSPIVVQFTRVFKIYRMKLIEEALSGKRFRILRSLYAGSKTTREIQKDARLSEKRTYHYLSRFESSGLVRNVKGRYILSRDHSLYKGIDILLSKPPPYSYSPEIARDAVVSWVGVDEYLIKTDKPLEYIKNLPPDMSAITTSTSSLALYSIDVIAPSTTLYVANKSKETLNRAKKEGHVTVEDLIIHLLLDDPYTEKTRRYIHWLIQKHEDKIDFRYLKRKATEYKLQKKIESLLYDLKPILKRR